MAQVVGPVADTAQAFSSPQYFDFSAHVGSSVSVRTAGGETLSGELYCYDAGQLNLVVLSMSSLLRALEAHQREDAQTAGAAFKKFLRVQTVCAGEDKEAGKADFHVVRRGAIIGISIEKPLESRSHLSRPPLLDKSNLDRLEKLALADFEKRKYRIGVGVTAEAQDLFDFIWKTHPDCVWREQDIVIQSLEVSIRPPYDPSSVSGRDWRARERITSVISKFRQRREREAARQLQNGTDPSSSSKSGTRNGAPDSAAQANNACGGVPEAAPAAGGCHKGE